MRCSERERQAAKRRKTRRTQGKAPGDQRRKPAERKAWKATVAGRASKQRCRKANKRRLLANQKGTVLLKRKKHDRAYRMTEKAKSARRLRAAALGKKGRAPDAEKGAA